MCTSALPSLERQIQPFEHVLRSKLIGFEVLVLKVDIRPLSMNVHDPAQPGAWPTSPAGLRYDQCGEPRKPAEVFAVASD